MTWKKHPLFTVFRGPTEDHGLEPHEWDLVSFFDDRGKQVKNLFDDRKEREG